MLFSARDHGPVSVVTVALLHIIDFLSKNRPQRTVVFNINNGEEMDDPHGAQTCAILITVRPILVGSRFRNKR